MKILFLHVYSEFNCGDAAIVEVMLDDYRARFPEAEITISSITASVTSEFHGASYVTSLFYKAIYESLSPWKRIVNTSAVIGGTILQAYIYKWLKISVPLVYPPGLSQFTKALQQADLVVAAGGGYILGKASWQSTLSLVVTLLELWYAKQYGKTVHLYSQSIGPFSTPFQRNSCFCTE